MANSQQINVGINFQANVSQAKQQIESLQSSLKKIAETEITVQGGSVSNAIQSANQLQRALESAVNVDTKKLDFSALQTNLKSMGTDILSVSRNLLQMGPEGQKAFSQLGTAIATAELPAKRLNSTLVNFGDTLIRTIRWQVASSLIHGFMGTVKSAVGYIEDLDKSLNAIQVVTQKNTSEMIGFANKASELAGNLKTVTKEYTDASLIFFQQGLDTSEVIERTNTTIKLAKVTGESVSNVASQLTAIWNNFDDGTKNLEYYADVITALGAATASSSDEISQGLSKFASVADTVGLSYEKATAALATVTANTRQSADVIGTSFRTIFARMEGLSLGETLDDGVTLNKYSSALAKIGVNILDQNNQLRDMDTILDMIGARWQTLTDAQRNALAQTVAGVRQYTQFVSLMDNYQEVLKNESIAENSAGTIQKQFDIYADSIEALDKEIEKAKQDIYDSILNQETVKGFKDSMLDILKIVKDVIDGFGGVKGIILTIGGLLLTNYLPKIEEGVYRLKANFEDAFDITTFKRIATLTSLREQNKPNINENIAAGVSGDSNVARDGATLEQQQAYYTDLMLQKRLEIESISRNLTDKQRESLQIQMQELEVMRQQAVAAREKYEITKEEAERLSKQLTSREIVANYRERREEKGTVRQQIEANEEQQQYIIDATKRRDMAQEKYKAASSAIGTPQRSVNRYQETVDQLKKELESATTDEDRKTIQSKLNEAEKKLTEANEKLAQRRQEQIQASENLKKAEEEVAKTDTDLARLNEELKVLQQREQELNSNKATEQDAQRTQDLNNYINEDLNSTGGENEKNQVFQDALKQLQGEGAEVKVDVSTLQKASRLLGEMNGQQKIYKGLAEDISKTQKLINKLSDDSIKDGKEKVKVETQVKNELEAQTKRIQAMSDAEKKQLAERLKNTANAKEAVGPEDQIDLTKLQGNAKGIKEVSVALGEMGTESTNAEQKLRAIVSLLIDQLGEKLGIPKERLEKLRRSFEDLGRTSVDVNNQNTTFLTAFGQGFEIAADKLGQFTQGAQKAVGGITNVTMGANMMSTGFIQLQEAIEGNGSALSTLTGIMMIARGAMAALSAGQQVLTLVSQLSAKATQKETAVTSENTVATTGNAVAKTWAAFASKGLAGVAAGLLVTGIIISTVAIAANTVATNNNTKAKIATAKAAEDEATSARESAQASREELEEITKLNNEYQRGYALYEKNHEEKDALRAAIPSLVDKLEEENLYLLLQQERYEALNKAIEENIQKTGERAQAQADQDVEASRLALNAKVDSVEGGFTTVDVENNEGKVVGYANRLPISDAATLRWLNTYLSVNPVAGWGVDEAGLVFYSQNNPENAGKISEIANGFITWAQENIASFSVANNAFVKAYQQAQEGGEIEKFESLTESAQNRVDTSILNAKNSSGIASAQSFAEYQKSRNEMLEKALGDIDKNSKEGKAIAEDVSKALLEDEALAEYERQNIAYEGQKAKWGVELDDDTREALIADGFTEEQIVNAFIHLDIVNSTEDLKKQIEDQINRDGTTDLTVALDVLPSIKTDLKKEMTAEEKEAFNKKYGDLLFDDEFGIGLTQEEFDNRTYDERTKIINEWVKGLDKASILEKKINDLTEEGNRIEENRENAISQYIEEKKTDEDGEYYQLEQRKKNFNTYIPDLIYTANTTYEGNLDTIKAYYDDYLNNIDNNAIADQDKEQIINFIKENPALQELVGTAKELGLYLDKDGAFDYIKFISRYFADTLQSEFTNEVQGKLDFLGAQITSDAEDQVTGIERGITTAIDGAQAKLDSLSTEERDLKIANLGLDEGELADYIDYLQRTNAELANNHDKAVDVAIAVKSMEKGFKDLTSHMEDYNEVLRKGNKQLPEYQNQLQQFRKDLSFLFNQDVDLKLAENIADDAEAMQYLEDAINGSNDAWEKFTARSAAIEIGIVDDGEIQDQFLDVFNALQQLADLSELEIGATLDDTGLIDTFNTLLATGKMTAAEIEAAFNNIGFAPEFEVEWQQVDQSSISNIKMGSIVRLDDPNGEDQVWSSDTLSNLQTNQTVWVPKLKNATKTSVPKPSSSFGSAGKGSGGGGGGGSRSKKDLKKRDDEIERYHQIDKTIDSLAKQYTRLKNARDAAYGADKLKILEQETKLIQQQTNAARERAKEAENYLRQDRANIEAYGAIIDENGVISNYEQIMDEQLNKLNSIYSAYNAGGSSDEAVEKAEKEYDQFKEILSQYEETYSTFQDALEEVAEKVREQVELALEKIDVSLQLKLDIPESEIKKIEFRLKRLEDSGFAASQRIIQLNAKLEQAERKSQSYMEAWREAFAVGITDDAGNLVGGFGFDDATIDALLEGRTEVLEGLGLTGENKQAVLDKLEKLRDNLEENWDEIHETLNQIQEEYTNAFGEYVDELEREVSRIEKFGNIMQGVKDLIGTMGKDTLGISNQVITRMNQMILSNSQANIASMRKQQEALQEVLRQQQQKLEEARERYAQNSSIENANALKFWEEQVKTTEDKIDDMTDSLISKVNDFAQKAGEILQEETKSAFDEVANSLYGMSFEDAQASFDRYKALSDATLQDYQKIYELSKLTRQITNSIDETDNIKAKQLLRDLQAEINQYQAEGVKMTQYEVDYLNKKYELRLAEIALEEAQNAKDQVRLARNADGGWGYVYTANAENIESAQQNYEDKLYALQELNRQTLEDTTSTILQINKEYQDAMVELVSSGLSPEDLARRQDELAKHYGSLLGIFTSTFDKALANNRSLYTNEWDNLNTKYGYPISADRDFIDKFEETWLGQQGIPNGLNSAVELFEKFQQRLGDSATPGTVLYDCSVGFQSYVDSLKQALEASGLGEGGDFGSSILNTLSQFSSQTDEIAGKVDILADKMKTDMASIADSVSDAQSVYSNKLTILADNIEKVTNATNALRQALSQLASINYSNIVPSASATANIPSVAVNTSDNGGGAGGSGTPPTTNPWNLGGEYPAPTTYYTVNLVRRVGGKLDNVGSYTSYSDAFKALMDRYKVMTGATGSNRDSVLNTPQYWASAQVYSSIQLNKAGENKPLFKLDFNLISGSAGSGPNLMAQYDSGGYTGSFGPEGRMAVLHEKELVLNKEDTENVLGMVSMAREAMGAVSLGSHLSNIKAYNSRNNTFFGGAGIGQQTVSIEAHFPNVVDHFEIEQALTNLANYASQNAYNFDLSQRVNIF